MQIVDRKIKRDHGLSIFIVTVAVAILLGFFLIYPKYQDYAKAKEAYTSESAQITMLQDDKNNVSNSIGKLQLEKSSIDRVNQAIPDSENLPDLYAYIETLAKDANLKITQMQSTDDTTQKAAGAGSDVPVSSVANLPGGVKAATPAQQGAGLPENVGVITVNMGVSGDLANFNQFLSGVENSLRLMDVQSVDVSALKDRNALTFEVTLKTYYQKQ